MNKKKDDNNKTEIVSIILISVLVLLIWDTSFVYPIKIFVVLLHEISHAIMTIFTGGTIAQIKLNSNLSGITQVKGGNQILIAASGYFGSLIFGSLLFLSSKYYKLRIWFSTILATILLLSAINLIKGGFIIFITLIIAVIFYILPRYLNEKVNKIALMFIGLTSCFYVIADIKQDLLTTTLRETDSQILEYLTGIPAITFGLIWFLISIAVVYFLIRDSITTK